MRYLIAGIDTGKTAAISCISLNGEILLIMTKKYGSINWFVDTIKKIGSPVVIASDKKHANSTITKLASIFDAVLFNPKEDISVSRKMELSNTKLVKNFHERDALSAAFNAYFYYVNKLNQVEHLVSKKGVADIDEIKAKVIKKSSVYEAVSGKKNGRFIR